MMRETTLNQKNWTNVLQKTKKESEPKTLRFPFLTAVMFYVFHLKQFIQKLYGLKSFF